MKAILNALGSAGASTLGTAFIGIILLGPFIVADVIPDQAYHYTLLTGVISIVVFVLALVVGIAKPARVACGVVMFICAALVSLFLWTWSVLIVNATWGLIVVYVANFFFAVGAVVVAFFAALMGAHWSILWQIVVIGIVAFVMQTVAAAYAMSGEDEATSTPGSLT